MEEKQTLTNLTTFISVIANKNQTQRGLAKSGWNSKHVFCTREAPCVHRSKLRVFFVVVVLFCSVLFCFVFDLLLRLGFSV